MADLPPPCVTCRHHTTTGFLVSFEHRGLHPNLMGVDHSPVTGRITVRHPTCFGARMPSHRGCDREGRLWEPKPPAKPGAWLADLFNLNPSKES